jgi:hypothetical protein
MRDIEIIDAELWLVGLFAVRLASGVDRCRPPH